MSTVDSVSSRTARLKKIIDSNQEASPALTREALLDTFNVVFNRCTNENLHKNDHNAFEFTRNYREVYTEMKKLRVNINDFTLKTLIGKGYFGDVFLAIENITRDVYAIKKMPKASFIHSKEERNIMVVSNSVWIPSLQYAFQDQSHLYLVMEYLPGGNLLNLMIRNGAFTEELSKFYLAETLQALHALHSLGYVHRDIKPENILFDRCGHLKLADFGSAAKLDKGGHVIGFTPVGTPDYIAPELLQSVDPEKPMRTVYNETCDFWSMGIIAYEMITETTPFHSDNVNDTYAKILAHVDKNRISYPKDVAMSADYRNLIENLVTKSIRRFDYKKIITHSLFCSINWDNLRRQVPPIIPTLSGDDDTSNFDGEKRKNVRNNTYDKPINSINGSNHDLLFVGFSYVNEENFADAESDIFETPQIVAPSNPGKSEVRRLSMQVKSLQKTIDSKATNITSLQQNLTEYQRKSAQMDSVEKILAITKSELNDLKDKLKEKTMEIVSCKTQIKKLENSLKGEEEARTKFMSALDATHQKWERSRKKSEECYEKKIMDKNKEIMSLKQNVKDLENEHSAKLDEFNELHRTVDRLRDRLKSSTHQTSDEKEKLETEIVELKAKYERQISELKTKLQHQQDKQSSTDTELRKLERDIQDKNESERIINNYKEKISNEKIEISAQLQKEMEENQKLKSEKLSVEIQLQETQAKLDEALRSRARSPQRDGCASVYCSFESIPSSLVEEQLRKDLIIAKEGESEQRMRADRLETLIKSLEAAVERLSVQNAHATEELLERKNEKLEGELISVREQAIIDRQSSRTANLSLWKLEKELSTIKFEKEKIEKQMKKLESEKERLERRVNEEMSARRSSDEKIAELKSDIRSLKTELTANRFKLSTIDEDRSASRGEIISLNSRLEKLQVDLEEAKIKIKLVEQQKSTLAAENKEFSMKLQRANDRLQNVIDDNEEIETKFAQKTNECEKLKAICVVLETQLNELESMYKSEISQNKIHAEKINKLNEVVKKNELKMKELQNELGTEKSQLYSLETKSSDLCTQLDSVKRELTECQRKCNETYHDLLTKSDALDNAEELIEVQKEEIQNLNRIKSTKESELIILKEENSRIITDLYACKELSNQMQYEYENLKEQFIHEKKDLENEIIRLNDIINEMEKHHKQREIKFKETQSQYEKLIDHLQKRIEDMKQKKKKTLVEVIFGHGNNQNDRENISPDELIKRKPIQISQSFSQSKINKLPDAPRRDDELEKAVLNELCDILKEKSMPSVHHFEMTLNEETQIKHTCVVCNYPFLHGNSFWQCKKCKTSVHRKCRGDVNLQCNEGEFGVESEQNNDEINTLSRQEYAGVLLREDMVTPQLKILCLYEIVDDIVLLGCISGLKSFNINTERIIHVANVDSVICISVRPNFPKCLLIAENGEKLLQVETRILEQRAQAEECLNRGLDYTELDLPCINKSTNDLWRFVIIDDRLNRKIDNPIAIAGTSTQIMVLQYDINTKYFLAIRSLVTYVTNVLFTAHTAILSADRYVEIDLQTLKAEEFLDMTDQTLQLAKNLKPMDALLINPRKYLICFEDFGIFVDEYGCRVHTKDKKPTKNIKWIRKANSFAYRSPLLFVSCNDGIQIIRLNSFDFEDAIDSDMEMEKREDTFIYTENVRIMGTSGKHGIFTLSKAEKRVKQMARIDGLSALRKTRTDSIDTLASNETEL